MNEKEFLFRAAHCHGLRRIHVFQLVSAVLKNQIKLNSLSSEELAYLLKIPIQHAESFLNDWCRFNAKAHLDKYRQDHIRFVTFLDEEFPPLLRTIPDPPLYLFFIGNPKFLHYLLSLSVVGTRTPTQEGIDAMNQVLKPLVQERWLFVSGLAKGVDGYAHQLALESHTIAVLGSGFYHLYPKEHVPLFKRITAHHLALSEYPPMTRPQKWLFPERNRIISGLTPATLVVEAKVRSGSLITADQALEQGRDVLAIPGTVVNPFAQGTNNLIKQGASLVTTSEDIINAISPLTSYIV